MASPGRTLFSADDKEARDYLKSLLYTHKEVDDWLAGKIAHGEVRLQNPRLPHYRIGHTLGIFSNA